MLEIVELAAEASSTLREVKATRETKQGSRIDTSAFLKVSSKGEPAPETQFAMTGVFAQRNIKNVHPLVLNSPMALNNFQCSLGGTEAEEPCVPEPYFHQTENSGTGEVLKLIQKCVRAFREVVARMHLARE